MKHNPQSLARWAALAAGLTVGAAVAANAARDAIFLSTFGSADLPWIMMVSSVTTLVVAAVGSWLQGKLGPDRFAPGVALFCGLATLGSIGGLSLDARLFGVLFYVLVASVLGAVMPAMWSVFNERFDPLTGKKAFATIAWASTIGSILGGFGAERLASLFGQRAVLGGIGTAFLLATVILVGLVRVAPVALCDRDTTEDDGAPVDHRFLASLAVLLVSLAIGSQIVDFVLKDAASARWSDEQLLRFFALFYAGIGLLGFLGQVALSARIMRWLGPARSAGVLPFGLVAASVGGMALAPLAGAVVLKSVASSFKTVFFRASYELLFVPMPDDQKRFAKLFIDVGMTSLGGALGGGVLAGLVAVEAPPDTYYAAVVVTSLVAGAAIAAVGWGYVRSLSSSVVEQARDQSLSESFLGLAPEVEPLPVAEPADVPDHVDPVSRQFRVLRSRDAEDIRELLRSPIAGELLPLVVELLAWDEVSELAKRAIATLAPQHTGALADVLLDPERPFALRRRTAQVLEHGAPERAVQALSAGLFDPRFEVRYHCARALLRLRDQEIEIPAAPIEAAILAELEVDQSVWASRKLLDEVDRDDLTPDDALDESFAHVFRLFATLYPHEPIRASFIGLLGDDPGARGTAIEYLDNVLPAELRQPLETWISGLSLRRTA